MQFMPPAHTKPVPFTNYDWGQAKGFVFSQLNSNLHTFTRLMLQNE